MSDLIINGKDALLTWGVRMGEGFLDAIDEFPTMKPYIENESRLENGKRVSVANAKVAARQINLPFTLEGVSESDYRIKKKAFEAELIGGVTRVSVPSLGGEVFNLIYLGKGATYAMNRDRTFSRISLKFEEPNPSDRK